MNVTETWDDFRSRMIREEREEVEAARCNPWNGVVSLGEQEIRTPGTSGSSPKIRKLEVFADIGNPNKMFVRTPGGALTPTFDRSPAPRPEPPFWASTRWPGQDIDTEPTKEEPLEPADPIVAAAARLLTRWLRG